MIKNHVHFEPVASVDCCHLRTLTGGQLCGLIAYDADRHVSPMCFALFRTETAANWQMFMEYVFKYFPCFLTIISDGAKGLETLGDLFARHGAVHARCAWHIIVKNARKAGIAMTDQHKARAWTIVRSRTRAFMLHHVELLRRENPALLDFLAPTLEICSTAALLEKGKPRRGLVTSNPSEQFNSLLGGARDLPVYDLVQAVLAVMADKGFQRRTSAAARVNAQQHLVPRAEYDHTQVTTARYLCFLPFYVYILYWWSGSGLYWCGFTRFLR